MPLDFARARPLLQACDFPKLFVNELGWEPCHQNLTLSVGGHDHGLTAIAEKRGFIVWLCESPDGGLPDHTTRLKLDRALAQTSFEHLLVFVTGDRSRQSWMWVRREPGRPLSARTHEYSRTQSGESLLQRLQILFVSLEEEEAGLSVTEISGRARKAFDVERVTKRFYEEFRKQHAAFLKFITGIPVKEDQEWYASVMLNRLMFIYFIQRKGFLDGHHDYLRNRLIRTKQEFGKDKFYSFYRYFLLSLFHEGLGGRERTPELEKLLGRIPYLNGGLFDIHELERPDRYGKAIQIPDKAFEAIFDYFDGWQWHLDERPLRAGNEINPGVLGYIFEKYINQKQMGAYYTEEDITEYIGKNTVIPFLFDDARAKCKIAFDNPNGPTIWDLLKADPERYIYPALLHGKDKSLPANIAAGLNDVSQRTSWNKPASAEFALPTEIWREVVARRKRCEELLAKLAGGEVRDINDLITLNLNIRQFAQDVIENCEGPELLRAFWHAIEHVTILDTTAGSGAFLFAALNVLEPLYEACLDRMGAFVEDLDRSGEKHRPEKFSDFRKVLENVAAHPNRRYFIFKSIILNNLFGVDIMEEAVEICKLRLFLKLAAQVEPDAAKDNFGIEPLPDIDFNIRAGNTLVGYATADEVRRAFKESPGGQAKLLLGDSSDAYMRFEEQVELADRAFSQFRDMQTEHGMDAKEFVDAKQTLRERLKAIEEELNHYLAGDYGVKVTDKTAYAKWVKSHQPFHWFVEFYGIVTNGGFDVIIGNPPYVEYSRSGVGYRIPALVTAGCDNLWAFVLERALSLINPAGRMSLITPLSLVSTERFAPAYQLLASTASCATFLTLSGDAHPSVLFAGVKMSFTIFTYAKANHRSTEHQLYTSKLYRWLAAERENLFSLIEYHPALPLSSVGIPFKVGSAVTAKVITKINAHRLTVGHLERKSGVPMLYHRIVRHFVKALFTAPYFQNERDGEKKSEDYKLVSFEDEQTAKLIRSHLVSSSYYLFFLGLSDAYHCGRDLVLAFPTGIDKLSKEAKAQLIAIGTRYERDLFKHSVRRRIRYQATGWIEYDEFYPRESKPVADEIDQVLAAHYGFTAEELDFIINYDIKYRMGREEEADDPQKDADQ